MRFETPAGQVAFEIPDDWWSFTEMDNFSLEGHRYYAYPLHAQGVDVVPLSHIEPPMRNSGEPPFKKYKMVPILFALSSPECALPPVARDIFVLGIVALDEDAFAGPATDQRRLRTVFRHIATAQTSATIALGVLGRLKPCSPSSNPLSMSAGSSPSSASIQTGGGIVP